MNLKPTPFLLTLAFLIIFPQFSGQKIIQMETPAQKNSAVPNLHVAKNGKIYLSWMESPSEDENVLCFSTITNNKWSSPIKIAEGDNWFVNWADFPGLVTFGDKSIASHILVKSGKDSYAYNVNVTLSNNSGTTWTKPFPIHFDNTETEHGFVSMVPFGDNRLFVTWLDGRNYDESNKNSDTAEEMTLRSAVIDKNGKITGDVILDNRVCSCCGTDAAITSNGPIVIYRDRSKQEIRDFSIVRYINGNWTKPKTFSNDNWKIAGCPVNGAAVDAKENLVAVAWFTAANDKPEVKVVFSKNGGETFEKSMKIHEGNPWGRVDVALLKDGSALVSWLETIHDETVIKVRRIKQDGTLEKSIVVSKPSEIRSSGFPKMVIKDNTVYFAWTLADSKVVKTAYLKLD